MGQESDPSLARRCVVWHRCGVEASRALVSALVSRGLAVEVSGSGHGVLAMACAVQQQGRGLIVVLDGGGAELMDQTRVLEAMERFCPSRLVWVYEEGANPPIRGVVGKSGRVRSGGVAGRDADGVGRSVGNQVESELEVGAKNVRELRISGMSGEVKTGLKTGLKTGVHGLRLTASDVLDGDELAALLEPSE